MSEFQLTSINEVKKIIYLNNLKIKKSLGQNFLINKHIVDKIIKNVKIKKKDYVLEIGPGLGVLTKELIKKTNNLLAVEIDKEIVKILKNNISNFGSTVIINKDILKINNIETIFKDNFLNYKPPITVVANLPYYIATPILMSFFQKYKCFENIIFMVQKELGERIINNKFNKNYGSLSVISQYYGYCEKIANVTSNSFYPKPKIESVLIKIFIKPKKDLNEKEEKILFKLIRASFNQRRKILLNSLGTIFEKNKNKIKIILNKGNIDENRRGETLSVDEFKNLAKLFNKYFEIK